MIKSNDKYDQDESVKQYGGFEEDQGEKGGRAERANQTDMDREPADQNLDQ